ncbi:MAG: hypothetical protein AAGE96_14805 [Cyanobacteria bacterium P01_G01_bin.19]
MPQELTKISGIVRPGHQVASGMAKDSPYAFGTLKMQLPHFQKLGLDLSDYFLGTLNISIAPHKFKIKNPQYTFPLVKWHPDYQPETFSFSPCQLTFRETVYRGLIYYPHPETKIGHFQSDSIIEVISYPISEIKYGDAVKLRVDSSEVSLGV